MFRLYILSEMHTTVDKDMKLSSVQSFFRVSTHVQTSSSIKKIHKITQVSLLLMFN